jgi:leucyl aminopeptidase
MQIVSTKDFNKRKKADVLIIPFFEDKASAKPLFEKSILKHVEKYISKPIGLKDFKGSCCENFSSIYPEGKFLETRIVLLGLGKIENFSSDKNILKEHLRKAFGTLIKTFHSKKITSLNILLPTQMKSKNISIDDIFEAVLEGSLFSNYLFDEYISKKKNSLIENVAIVGFSKPSFSKMIEKKKHIADALFLTRDLVNGNADDVNPSKIAKIAKSLEKISKKVKVEILSKKEIEQKKMGLLLAVGKASPIDPTFSIIKYMGNPKSKKVEAIVGKGVTYDSGGLCLKPAAGMLEMKTDMAGAAAVIGTIHALASLNSKVNVIGIIPATENSIDSKSYKVGDVYKSYSGKTVEIDNTDAEGRLILADALSYVIKNFKPERVFDMATLTGAVCIALGEDIAGVFSNNEALYEDLEKASKNTSDRIWRLPLYKGYNDQIESKIADIKNCGSRIGSLITSALFLSAFVEDSKTPWAHIDIAGSSHYSKPKGYHPLYATGAGVRLMVDYFERTSS